MGRILIVDDDRQTIDLLTQPIASEGHVVQSAADADSALHRLRAWKPHLLLVNIDLPNFAGFELVNKIRTIVPEEYTSVVLISTQMNLERVVRALESGADDCLAKPFQSQDIILKVRTMLRLKEVQDSLKRAYHRIEELSSTDDLTGLMNMRAVYRRGEEEILRSKRFRKPVSSLLLNLDDFSNVNQTYGFIAGSHVLQETATRIKQCIRSIDFVARIGADEFFVFLTETDLSGAEFMAERIRDSIQSNPFKNEKQSIKLTATIGVAGLTHDQTHQRMSDLLHISTEALRSAKANGSNRIEVYSFT